ncbi:conserved hypothetical protein [Candidatus Desulfarcum epimagneticum]|uniref:TIGR01777 family protein n=1 Tax=uncultured Desulfobacteraceae bacterium TaxID=218296 RepID=A0A484HIP0_9BACT|nr:conserved hypothetical protein [uncultured Desulfobacteraceae bacterium]
MKNILIVGAAGFVGKELSRAFLSEGWAVTGVDIANAHPFSGVFDAFSWISADTTREGKWQKAAADSDAVVNLAGRSIFSRWTKKTRQSIYDSRVLTTRNIVAAMGTEKKQTLLNTSAVGFYGDCGDDKVAEDRKPGRGFLADVCVDWEKEALAAAPKGVRTAVTRFGIVMGNGGALALMSPAFKMFAGGPLGSGRQWFSWIHIQDLQNAFRFIMDHDDLEGVFNFTAPHPLRQKDFARSLGRALKRPSFVPAPAFMVRLAMGELGASLMQSQRAVPEKLLKAGFSFSFPDADSALADIFGEA